MKTPMTPLEREFADNYDLVATTFRRVRNRIVDATDEKLSWYEIVSRAQNCRELQLLENQVGFRWFRAYVYRDLMPDKAGPPRSRNKQRDLFNPDEVEVVDGKVLPRRRWNKEFMDALRQQKVANISAAQHKLQLHDFECEQIYPWFALHPDWVWIDAYNAIIMRDGAFPDPPEF